jgi:hypothetical protein
MSNICNNPTLCPNGNCIGCQNGQLYCGDPRCNPSCNGCNTQTKNASWIIITIILVLLGILLILAFIVGYDWYKKSQLASEPKNITVNKHVHNIKQPSIVVSQPAPQIVAIPSVTQHVISNPELSTSLPVEHRTIISNPISIPTSSVTYEGMSLPLDGIEENCE